MDLEAFENRVLPAKNKLFRFALRFLGNEEEARDIVQEVFIKVWNGRDQMDGVQTWRHGVCASPKTFPWTASVH